MVEMGKHQVLSLGIAIALLVTVVTLFLLPWSSDRRLNGESNPLRTFLSETWLPTLLFALPVFSFEFLRPGGREHLAGTLTVYVLIVTPPLWWMTRARRQYGAWRGAICGAILVLIPTLWAMGSCVMLSRSHEQSGAMAIPLLFMVLIIAAAILVPLGAVIGVVTTRLDNRDRRAQPS